MKLSQALLLTTILISSTIAHPEYRQRIPNSMNVVGVDALGHVDPAGGGPRNAFGNDFDSAGRKWTTALCQKDSDGDGQTNGQELGDPCCQWVQTTNAQVLWSKGVSAPGDATSKSNPSLWANVTCTTSTPSTTTTPGPSTGTAPERHGGITVMAIALVCTVAVVNVIGV